MLCQIFRGEIDLWVFMEVDLTVRGGGSRGGTRED